MTGHEQDLGPESLDAARKRRIELKDAIAAVEMAAAGPTGDPVWRAELAEELRGLQVALDQHVEEVEAPTGILAELLEDAPRLANTIQRVKDEHPPLCEQVAHLLNSVTSEAPLDEVRGEVLDTLVALSRHRQRGADLVYEAYNVDIGGG